MVSFWSIYNACLNQSFHWPISYWCARQVWVPYLHGGRFIYLLVSQNEYMILREIFRAVFHTGEVLMSVVFVTVFLSRARQQRPVRWWEGCPLARACQEDPCHLDSSRSVYITRSSTSLLVSVLNQPLRTHVHLPGFGSFSLWQWLCS